MHEPKIRYRKKLSNIYETLRREKLKNCLQTLAQARHLAEGTPCDTTATLLEPGRPISAYVAKQVTPVSILVSIWTLYFELYRNLMFSPGGSILQSGGKGRTPFEGSFHRVQISFDEQVQARSLR